MRPTLPFMSDEQIALMPNGALLIRFMEADRRLQRMPGARWLYARREQAWEAIQVRKAVGVFSPALCGILAHHLQAQGGIHHCDCEPELA